MANWRPGHKNKGKAAAAAAAVPASESAADDAVEEEEDTVDTDGDASMAGTTGTEGPAMLCAVAPADSHRVRDDETAAIGAAIAVGGGPRVHALVRRGWRPQGARPGQPRGGREEVPRRSRGAEPGALEGDGGATW